MISTRIHPHKAVSKSSLTIAAVSTTVEWYDFTIYLYFSTVLARVFFGGGDGALLLALGGFAISYLMRPLGAVAFGWIGDRYGRRPMMLLSVALMSLAMLAVAMLPTNAQIGSAAGWALIALRCVMAFSVGGEYSGVTAYLMEGAPIRRRGLVTSFAPAASEVGALLAVGVSALTVAVLPQDALDGWGWRIPFLIGTLLAGVVLVARSMMQESPDFEDQQARGTVPAHPLRHTLAHHRPALLRTFAISALASITYYVGIISVPAFLASAGSLDERDALWLSTIAAIAVVLVTPIFGAASDRFGRKPVLAALALCCVVLPVAIYALMASGSPAVALLGAVLLACLAGGVSAVSPIASAEQFPGEGRLTGLALGATVATTIFGGFTPYIAQWLMENTGWRLVPGAMIAAVALCVLPVLIRMPETAPRRQSHVTANAPDGQRSQP